MLTGGLIAVKEKQPQGVFQTGIDFDAHAASNGSPSTVNWSNLLDPAQANLLDIADTGAGAITARNAVARFRAWRADGIATSSHRVRARLWQVQIERAGCTLITNTEGPIVAAAAPAPCVQ